MQSERRYFRFFRKNIVSCFGQCLHLYAAPKTQSHASDGEMITARYARLPQKNRAMSDVDIARKYVRCMPVV